MSTANPYESPSSDVARAALDSHLAQRDADLIRYAQLGLRLLGVMFFVEGVAGVIASLIYGGLLIYSYGISPESLYDSYLWAWFAGSAPLIIAGLYFVTSGRWVIEKVFMPAPRDASLEPEEGVHREMPEIAPLTMQ